MRTFISYRPVVPSPRPRMPWKLVIGGVLLAVIAFIVIPVIFFRRAPSFQIIAPSSGRVAGQSTQADPAPLYPFSRQPQDAAKYSLSENPDAEKQLLAVNAESVVVADVATGEVVYAKAPHLKRPIASLTKIFTAVTAYENIDMNHEFLVSDAAANQQPDKLGVKSGERYRLDELLYGLFLVSGNDAAEVIAEGAPGGREKFIDAMNTKAHWLGLSDTRLQNPSGLDAEQHFSTAWDVTTLMRYAYLADPDLKSIMGTKQYHFGKTHGHRDFWITHISDFFKENPAVQAVKTGYTETAGYCWSAVLAQNGKEYVITFLNSWQGKEDATKLVQRFLP